MIDKKFLGKLTRLRLGDRMYDLIDPPCYKVPFIWEPNGHLYCSWTICDREAEQTKMTIEHLFECYVEPAMLSIAVEINKHDVCLCSPLEVSNGQDVFSHCYEEEAVPIRLTVAYDPILLGVNGGHRFTIDLMTDLLTKGKL